MDVGTRIQLLRQEMKKEGIHYYLITSQDYHDSEYVSDHFKERAFVSGFTGSNGSLLVGENMAGLWTDGRYFLQAENQLKGTEIELFKMEEPGVPTILEYLTKHLQKGENIGTDGRCISVSMGEKLEKLCQNVNGKFCADLDLPDRFWDDRPERPATPIWVFGDEFTGESAITKLQKVREMLQEREADAMWISRLDDLMWLCNLRAADVECNPVALSHAYIDKEDCIIFLQEKAMSKAVEDHLQMAGMQWKAYDTVIDFLNNLDLTGKNVLLNKEQLGYSYFVRLKKTGTVLDLPYPTEYLKAIKNPTEIGHMREAYKMDSAAVCKFIYWLKQEMKAGNNSITEISAAEKLDGLRKEIKGFLDLSFPTICGYKENASIIHYGATVETDKTLAAKGMLLVDSGGQYMQGTTDVTRTIVLGEISEEEKKQFTAVALGNLRLAATVFPQGCTGRNLDPIARMLLWQQGLDYRHGTGHGIGFCLNVHEGPHSIRWKYNKNAVEYVLEPGMLISDEPGYYEDGVFGIRTESIVMVEERMHTEYGQFLGFETLTWVPIDREAFDTAIMSKEDIQLVDDYHAKVYEKIAPYLEEKERQWLREVTSPLS